MTLSKTGKGGVDVGELSHLRDALLAQQQGASRLLAQINKVLNGVKTPEGKRTAASVAPARPSPLDMKQGVVSATADLRESSGNLSAARIAEVFGVSLSQLAGWLGRSKQAVSKTPDADSLQTALEYFERVARLRLLTKDNGEFRKWLRTPHPDIEAKNPLELLGKGKWQALADHVDDMLSGTPG